MSLGQRREMLPGLLLLILVGWGAAAAANAINAKSAPPLHMVFWRVVLGAPLLLVPILFGADLACSHCSRGRASAARILPGRRRS